MRIALLDSDIIAYRAAVLNESAPLTDAIDLAKRMTDAWTNMAGCDGYVSCFTTGPSFRAEAWPPYKAKRREKERPQHLSDILKEMKGWNACWHTGYEADDVLGILATYPQTVDEVVIVSVDKDLDQIPGQHCNPDKETIYTVSDDDADMYRWMQVLSGDSTDNYPGVPFVGTKKAQRILEFAEAGCREQVVSAFFESKELGHTFFPMVVCATLLTYKKGLTCEQSLQDSTEAGTLRDFLQSLKQYSM